MFYFNRTCPVSSLLYRLTATCSDLGVVSWEKKYSIPHRFSSRCNRYLDENFDCHTKAEWKVKQTVLVPLPDNQLDQLHFAWEVAAKEPSEEDITEQMLYAQMKNPCFRGFSFVNENITRFGLPPLVCAPTSKEGSYQKTNYIKIEWSDQSSRLARSGFDVNLCTRTPCGKSSFDWHLGHSILLAIL